jgi:hypothetical protein
VVDASGKPVPDRDIELRDASGNVIVLRDRTGRTYRRLRTDDAGRIEAVDVPLTAARGMAFLAADRVVPGTLDVSAAPPVLCLAVRL